MRVEVYWNFHKKMFSIRALEGPRKGRVINRSEHVTLAHVTFKVSAAGRDRVRREKRKNVHAVVRGTLLCSGLTPRGMGSPVNVRYNPYRDEGFNHEGKVVTEADWVEMYVLEPLDSIPGQSCPKGGISAYHAR